MIDSLDTPERDISLLTRHRAMRPSLARVAFAELAGDLPLDELRHAADIFRQELEAREGKTKFTPPNAARRVDF